MHVTSPIGVLPAVHLPGSVCRRIARLSLVCAGLVAATSTAVHAAEPPRSSVTTPRTGSTQPFGAGTITRRSDGTTSQTRPFGSGSITTERGRDGRTITGQTQQFGSGTITRWSDGTTTRAQPFGSGTRTTETGRNGGTVTGSTQKFGTGTITTRSDGSKTQTQRFGSGTLQRDQPGSSRSAPTRGR
jgi:hypothetical protein